MVWTRSKTLKVGRGTNPQWKKELEVVERSSEREREFKEAFQQQKETIERLRGEIEKPTKGNESDPYCEMKKKTTHHSEDTEREREYREVVQHQQDTIERLMRVVEKYPESMNVPSEQVGEPITIVVKKNETKPVGDS